MKEKILELRSEGKTYNEIRDILGCSKSTISHHCSGDQKEKTNLRVAKFRRNNPSLNKGIAFRGRDFRRKNQERKVLGNFTSEELKEKLKSITKCYLSGRLINFNDPKSYQFDHIIPASRGGSNDLDNLGVVNSTINKMKNNLTNEELFEACKEILEYNGYKVIK